MLSDVCLFDVNEIERDATTGQYSFPVYTVDTGLLWYIVSCSSDMYQEQFAALDNKPYHLFFTARLIDVPMLTDIVGVVPEARQRLEPVECKILPSEAQVPTGFVNRATPTILPYTFEPGPKAGYYLVKMSGEAKFVPQRREEEIPMPEEEVDFGPDDFEEITKPTLSTFDVDVQSAQPARTATMFGALERVQKMRKATEKRKAAEMSAKKKGKQPAVARLEPQPTTFRLEPQPSTSRPPQPSMSRREPQPSTSAGTETTTAGTETTTSESTEPDYLGLLEAERSAAVVSPTFSSRVAQMVDELDVEEQLGEEETEIEGSGELKRRRTRESTGTLSIQDVKRSKTIAFLRDLQEKANKK